MTCADCIYFVNTHTGSRGGKYGECARKGKQTVSGRWILPHRWARNPLCSWGVIGEDRRERQQNVCRGTDQIRTEDR